MKRLPQPDKVTLDGADEGLDAGVGADVGAQVEIERELLRADLALVGLLAGVHQLVPLELAFVEELLVAGGHLADVLLLPVRGHVLLQRAVVVEDLAALVELALEALDRGLLFHGDALGLVLALDDLLPHF